MENKLKSLAWAPRWMSLVGGLYASSKYLGLGNTDSWIAGSSGLAFMLNIGEGMCPSGPTAWNSRRAYELVGNIGISAKWVFGTKHQPDFMQKYEGASKLLRESVESGNPALLFWALEPEFYVVNGVNDDGIFISGARSENQNHKRWNDLTPSGMIEAVSLTASKKVDDEKTVTQALKFAIDVWEGSENIILPNYSGGKKGYQAWIKAFDDPKLNGFGLAYNSQVWSECRAYAVDFLREARHRLRSNETLFDQAIGHAIKVSDCLKTVALQLPFMGMDPSHSTDPQRVATAKDALVNAKTEEEKMIDIFKPIISNLPS